MSEEKKTEDDSGANPTSSQRENLEVRPVAPETTDGEKGVKVARLFVWFERLKAPKSFNVENQYLSVNSSLRRSNEAGSE